jgi:type IV pilus secretin PilQ/predicted competence protein
MTRRSLFKSCVSTSLFLTLVASGCGPLGSSSDSMERARLEPETADSQAVVQEPTQPASNDAALLLAAAPQTVMASPDGESMSIDWQKSDQIERFALAIGSNVSYQASELTGPARLVVDLSGAKTNSGEVVEMADSQFVDRIRVGQHPGKSRVVFDLKQGDNISHDIQRSEDGSLSIAFAATDNILAMATTSAASAAPIAASASEIAETEIMPASGSPEFNADSKNKLMLASDTDLESAPKLIKLELAPVDTGAGNQVVAEMESAGYYSLIKSAPSEYILTLEDAAVSEFAAQPVIASADQGEIRSARAVQSGKDIQVRIFAKPNSFLQASAVGNQIVVAALDQNNSDFRAQVDPAQLPTESAADTTALDPAAPNADSIAVQPPVVVDQAPSDPTVVEIIEPDANQDAPAQADSSTDVVEVAETEEDANSDSAEIVEIGEEDFGDLLEKQYTGRLISLDLQETEIDNALRIIAEVSNLNIIASDDVTGKVTLRLIDVPWDQALDVILKTNGLDKVREGNVVRIAPVDKLRQEREALRQAQQAEEELESLKVQYLRISYAKAADLQPLVESVLTERGSVTYDDRTNQLIVKDITKGLKNVTKLVEKIDLRTPQVLVETQIVEANKNFVRELGAELGFYYLRTPETGNALGYNFPNSVEIGGSAAGANGPLPGVVSSFPAGIQSSAVSMLFGSADGTKGLDLRLSQGEREGLVKVISKPSVAVTNNSPAVIKSVEKVRIKLPSGGTTIGIGDQANAGGGGAGGRGTGATESFEVGIILNVTAQASPDYYVLMDIEAESSTLGSPGRGADEIPTEIERSATSSVLVSSGQTFAMGGIYKVSQQDQYNGVPFLKDIPILGQFFRNSSVVTSDEELIFFITPRVVEGSFDDASMQTVS